jgi:hypothetical protein
MNDNEKIIKIQLIEQVLAEAKKGVAIDMLLKKWALNIKGIVPIQDDDSDEVRILFSLIEYIVEMDLKESNLLSAADSKRLVVNVSKDNRIVDVSFENESLPNSGYDISFVYY